jgi:hypothetical protein
MEGGTSVKLSGWSYQAHIFALPGPGRRRDGVLDLYNSPPALISSYEKKYIYIQTGTGTYILTPVYTVYYTVCTGTGTVNSIYCPHRAPYFHLAGSGAVKNRAQVVLVKLRKILRV